MSAFAYDYKVTVSGGNSDPEVSLEGKKATITIAEETIEAGCNTDYIALRNQDLDLVVAYALKSDLVKYEIRYQDQGGNELLPAETHYGAAESRQVVSFKHVAGYLPNTYSYIGTLKKCETTVFTFSYSPAAAGEDTVIAIARRRRDEEEEAEE